MQFAFDLDLLPQARVPSRSGRARVTEKRVKSILGKATGGLSAYDFTLNPYTGCQFSCSYCYAAFFVPDEEKADKWGEWIEVKENAMALLRKARRLAGSTIYVGSVTDPYQPIEREVRLTRSLLTHMADLAVQPSVTIQTRSPFVADDIDLFKQFKNLRVNVSITTDDDEVRKQFEPQCASIRRRLETVSLLLAEGIDANVSVSPMLPISDPEGFARTLRDLGARKVYASAFHAPRGAFIAGTRQKALDLAREMGWGGPQYLETLDRMRSVFPELKSGNWEIKESSDYSSVRHTPQRLASSHSSLAS